MSATGAFLFGCEGPALADRERDFFREAQPWGFILFGRNVADPDQMRRLTGALREAVGRDAPILIDQEGGRVQRMTPPAWRRWRPPLDEVAALGPDRAAEGMRLRYRLIAAELRAVGIDVNCAPVGDLARDDTHPILLNRCYGRDPGTVIAVARAVAEGLMAGGVLPVLKHMPGHGRARVDSHLDLPRVTAPRAVLEAEDFRPFRALADLPMGMSAHLVYDAIDAGAPATVSTAMIGLIREGIGFDGLLMTDDLSMQALSGTVAERGRAARAAGCDMVLHCNGRMEEMEAVAGAVGAMDAAGAARADRALSLRRPPEAVDERALEAAFRALGGSVSLE